MKIHALQTGEVRVSPNLPFGGEKCGLLKAAGITTPKRKWIWIPVFCYLIEHPNGYVLIDTGWHREMSPQGVYDRHAQIKSLGSYFLYQTNQGLLPQGAAIDEQLAKMGISPKDLSYVVLTHLDCDHANGLKLVADAQNILVSADEMAGAYRGGFANHIRFQPRWWEGTKIRTFDWNGSEGPDGCSYDLWGDGSITLVKIPGHSAGMVAVRIAAADGRFVLLTADGAYARRSWQEMILPGIAQDRQAQKKSLEWIRQQSMSDKCVEVLATHDTGVKPHVIEL